MRKYMLTTGALAAEEIVIRGLEVLRAKMKLLQGEIEKATAGPPLPAGDDAMADSMEPLI